MILSCGLKEPITSNKKTAWSVDVTFKNVMNEKFYTTYYIADYYTNITNYTLYPRHLLVKFGYHF